MRPKFGHAVAAPVSKFLLTIAMLCVLSIAFGVYVFMEKSIDRANEVRHTSYKLADQLRQSSDDLTQMARSYVVTREPRFRDYYHQILDIRDGKRPRPKDYFYAYWDLVLAQPQTPSAVAGPAVSLLTLIHQSGCSEIEYAKLLEAKVASDGLARVEQAAMNLAGAVGASAPALQEQARLMLHDRNYWQGKAHIMQLINEFYLLMEQRTQANVQAAEQNAIKFRLIFIATALGAMFLLWRTYIGLRTLLGGSAAEVHAHMLRIGQGDFSSAIEVASGMEHSVLARLREMQHKLRQQEIEQQRAEEQLRIAAIVFESQEGMVVTDANNKILRVNRTFTETTGYTAEEAVGQSPNMLKSGRHDAEFFRAMWDSIQRTGGWQGEIWDRRKNGEIYPKWLAISAVKNGQGVVTHYVGTHFDITERKQAEEKINDLAFFDQLTGLPNRTLLQDRMKQAMATSARSNTYAALLFIDLDNFKTLNDTLGHETGDLLLKQVAKSLAACVREYDTVARLGGDEFVVILKGLSTTEQDAANHTETVAEKILAALNQMYRLGSVTHQNSASIGATLFRGTQTSLDDLMKQADLAMYRAKAAGRNAACFFDPAMEAVAKERAALENDLRQALHENQFLLHYQPQLAGVHLTGAEVLVRWQHPQRGLVSPAEFIPLAEETGLILPLGHWVLATACAQLVAWASQPEMAHLTVAVNVSASQFNQPDFVDQVLNILKQTGANPYRLKLELTESLLVKNVQDIIEKMFALKAKGVGFAIDDFGTGYSSLGYLKQLPLDQLKIDQSFVRDVLTDPNDAAIAKTIVALAQSLGFGVIAEGVETSAQRDFLASSGCHSYQGYFFSRPLPLAGFEQFAQRAATAPEIAAAPVMA